MTAEFYALDPMIVKMRGIMEEWLAWLELQVKVLDCPGAGKKKKKAA